MAGHAQVFQAIIEHGRVTAAVVDDGKYLGQVGIQCRLGLAFPGVEPIDIALNRIDFPVVDDVAVRMGPGPAGEGVRTETGMDESHGRCKIEVREIEIKVPQLDGGQHALIDDGPGREAGNIEIRALFLAGRNDFLFCQLADDVELAFKVHLRFQGIGAADKDLQKVRPRRLGNTADQAFVDRYVAPAQDGQAFTADDGFELGHLLFAKCFIPVGENHAYAVVACCGQRKT